VSPGTVIGVAAVIAAAAIGLNDGGRSPARTPAAAVARAAGVPTSDVLCTAAAGAWTCRFDTRRGQVRCMVPIQATRSIARACPARTV
jgi:hypothetical protein